MALVAGGSSSQQPQQPLLSDPSGGSSTPAPSAHSDEGLTTREAELRLAQDGPNELPDSQVNPCKKFLGYFWGPMPIMIWIAIIVEFCEALNTPQHWLDFAVLTLLQFVNGFVGWYEERNAGNAIAALKKELCLKANCKRDSVWGELMARELVRGDVVHLVLGCVVPADCDLLPNPSGLPIQVDQSSLNGESLPKTVHGGGRVFQGTIVKRGEIDAIVVDTGVNTFFGRASALVASAEKAQSGGFFGGGGGHFQRLVTTLTLSLLFLSLSLVSILAVTLLVRGERPLKVISIAVVLLVASIPIAMQVVCTSTMAVGAHKLAKAKALVCKLTAIEELAAMNILCSDKTGTLTKNELSVRPPAFVLNETVVSEDELLFFAALAAKRGGSEQDAIDATICADVQKRGNMEALEAYKTLHYVPFDPVTKRTEAIVEGPDATPEEAGYAKVQGGSGDSKQKKVTPVPAAWRARPIKVMKGAPQVILALSHDAETIHDQVTEFVNSMALKGYRTIGVARALGDSPSAASDSQGMSSPPVWEFLGLVPLFDPPRDDTKSTIAKARQLGIDVKMITGDQTAIAKQTARELNMGSMIYTADALALPAGVTEDSAQGAQRSDFVEDANGFAEVFPEHKFNIVQILQKRGHRVGMTGDGVNDAPALKAGNVGIAVKGATDAARAAADIVLTSDGLSVIIEAIARSRMIFERMRNYCIYRIACTTSLLFFFFFSMMFINPSKFGDAPEIFELPVLCLVFIVLLNDGCILTIAYDKVEPSIKPCNWNLREVVMIAAMMGSMSVMATMLLLVAGLYSMEGADGSSSKFYDEFWHKLGLPSLKFPQVQTMLYMCVSVLGFLTIFAARTRSFFFSRRPDKRLLFAAVFALAATTVIASTDFVRAVSTSNDPSPSGLPASLLGAVWVYCLIWFLLEDCAKTTLIRYLSRDELALESGEQQGFSSSFWRVRSVIGGGNPRAPSLVTSVADRSIIVAAQRIAGDMSAGAVQGSIAEQDAAASFTDMVRAIRDGEQSSSALLSKSSLISASMTAEPPKAGGKPTTPRPSLMSTAAGSTRPSRPSEGLSLWSDRASSAIANAAATGSTASVHEASDVPAVLEGAVSK